MIIEKSVSDWYENERNVDEMRSWGGRLKIWERQAAQNFARDGLVLDVGCGLGREAFVLAEAGFRVDGIDISAAVIRKAQAASRERRSDVCFTLYDGAVLPYENGRFDAVIIWSQTFGLMYEDERKTRFLGECKRVLKDGGILSYSGHDYDYVHANHSNCADGEKFFPYSNADIYWQLFTPEKLAQYASCAGFDVIYCERGEVYAPSDGYILNCLCRKPTT